MVAYMAETVRLEMAGTAHQVARSNNLRDRDFGILVAAHPHIQTGFIRGEFQEPSQESIVWPWPGSAGAEVIAHIGHALEPRQLNEE